MLHTGALEQQQCLRQGASQHLRRTPHCLQTATALDHIRSTLSCAEHMRGCVDVCMGAQHRSGNIVVVVEQRASSCLRRQTISGLACAGAKSACANTKVHMATTTCIDVENESFRRQTRQTVQPTKVSNSIQKVKHRIQGLLFHNQCHVQACSLHRSLERG